MYSNKNVIMNDNYNPVVIGIVAGEVSGDILGFELIKSLKKYLKAVSFFGIGGTRMKSENMECWYDISDLSVMGIVEVCSKLPQLLNIRRKLFNRLLALKPDVFIGIDFPDFNIFLEKKLKKRGIYTIHYVSPSVWAWRSNRIFEIKKATDNILVLFPFEKLIYDQFNIPCQLVGHILADKIPLYPNKIIMRQQLNIPQCKTCLAVLPGSRFTELKMLSGIFLNSIKLLHDSVPNLEILVPLHNQKLIDYFVKLAELMSVTCRIFHTQRSWEIMIASDISLLTAGTATLECMLAKCPMVVAYRMNPITFLLIKRLIKVTKISLPNILSGCNLVPEFIQKDCNPENLAQALLDLLSYNYNQLKELQSKFYMLHQSIKLHANRKIAHTILKHLGI